MKSYSVVHCIGLKDKEYETFHETEDEALDEAIKVWEEIKRIPGSNIRIYKTNPKAPWAWDCLYHQWVPVKAGSTITWR